MSTPVTGVPFGMLYQAFCACALLLAKAMAWVSVHFVYGPCVFVHPVCVRLEVSNVAACLPDNLLSHPTLQHLNVVLNPKLLKPKRQSQAQKSYDGGSSVCGDTIV